MSGMSQEQFNQEIELLGKVLQHCNDKDLEILDRCDNMSRRVLEENKICVKCQLDQLERYGISNWKDRFRRLDAEDPEGYQETYQVDADMAEEMRNKLIKWKLDKITPALKEFQECFSENGEFIIQLPGVRFEKSDIFGTFVSPRCIPDKLLTDLHLCDFSDCKGDPIKRLKLKASPEVIDSLKLIFCTLANYDGTFNREYILPEVHSVNPILEKKLAEYNKYCLGQILVFSDSNSQEAHLISGKKGSGIEFNRTKISIYKDADSRIRAGRHLQDSYSGEFKTLTSQISRLNEMVSFLGYWKRETPQEQKDEIRKEFLLTLQKIEKELERATNSFKINAMNDLDRIISNLSSNKMASIAVMGKAIRTFKERYDESISIKGVKNLDLDSITYKVNMAKLFFETFEKRFSDYLEVQDDASSWKKDFEFAYLSSVVDVLKEIKVAPYNVFASAIRSTFNDYKKFLESPYSEVAYFNLENEINKYLGLYHIRLSLCDALTPNLSLSNLQVHLEKVCDFLSSFINNYNNELNEKASCTLIALHDELSLLQDVSSGLGNKGNLQWGGKVRRKNDVVREELKKIINKYDISKLITEEYI